MRQAVVTKFLGPTSFQGSRVRAKAAAGALTVPWDHALNVEQNHAKAAEALVRKLGWIGEKAAGYAGLWAAGGLPWEAGNVFVFVGADLLHSRERLDAGDGFEV